jgi:predicted nucleic acid-binding protein
LPEGPRKTRLREAYLEHVAPLVASCPAFDAEAAVIWGELMGAGDAAGRQLPIIDAQIASIALVHELKVVTRNVRDFVPMGVATIDPWDEAGT